MAAVPSTFTLSIRQWYSNVSSAVKAWYNNESQSQSTLALHKNFAPSHTQEWTIHESNLAFFESLSCPKGNRPALPLELILQILAHPSRWVLCSTKSYNLAKSPPRPGQARVIHRQGNSHEPIMTTQSFSKGEVLSLVGAIFRFRSKDQGWSSSPRKFHGTYDQSYTWFEACIFGEEGEFKHPEEEKWTLQRNRHAGEEPEEYEVELLAESHPMFENLEAGDKIGLKAKAMYPGWENHVYDASIELWFAKPDDLKRP